MQIQNELSYNKVKKRVNNPSGVRGKEIRNVIKFSANDTSSFANGFC